MDFLKRLYRQAAEFIGSLSLARKISFVLVLLMVVGGLIAVILWGSQVEYRILYTDLSPQDANAIVESLKASKTPYRLSDNGTTVLVPVENYYDVRLSLAGQGIPQGGNIGYELFDEAKLGMSEFVQKLNYRRALEGELARTIAHLEEVKTARVHIVIPERALFEDAQEPATASVVLGLDRAALLTRAQVKGIVNLLTGSVEGLRAGNVSIVDSSGNILYDGSESTVTGILSQSQQELKAKIEKSIQQKITSLLEQTLGKDKVTARVDANIDFTSTDETREIYDPDKTAVRSEQRQNEESIGGQMNPAGVPGVRPNVEGLDQEQGTTARDIYRKQVETINYEITRVVQNNRVPAGSIEKLSVAVMVDGSYQKETDDVGKDFMKYVPRTDEELEKYRRMVENAIGYDELRGDRVTVVNLPFKHMAEEVDAERLLGELERRKMIASYVKYAVILLLALLVIFFVVRPMLRQLLAKEEEIPEERLLTDEERARLEALEAPEEEVAEKRDLLAEINALAENDPDKMVQLIRAWIR